MYITISTTSSVDPTFLRHSPHQPLHHIPRTQRATLDLARETWSAQNAGKIRKLFWYDWDSLERGYFMWYVTNYDVWVCLKMWYMCSFDWGIWRYNIVSKSEGKPWFQTILGLAGSVTCKFDIIIAGIVVDLSSEGHIKKQNPKFMFMLYRILTLQGLISMIVSAGNRPV